MPLVRNLSVWGKAHALAVATYRASSGTPSRNFPALVGQLQRASSAIAVNLSEGAASEAAEGFASYLAAAISSTREVEYLLLLASDLGAISKSNHAKLEARTDQVTRMLAGLRATVRRRTLTPRAPIKRVKPPKSTVVSRSE
ncbi:MAG: four helix bundle protein [Gemmatimonadaceae bacterium]